MGTVCRIFLGTTTVYKPVLWLVIHWHFCMNPSHQYMSSIFHRQLLNIMSFSNHKIVVKNISDRKITRSWKQPLTALKTIIFPLISSRTYIAKYTRNGWKDWILLLFTKSPTEDPHLGGLFQDPEVTHHRQLHPPGHSISRHCSYHRLSEGNSRRTL